LLRIVPDKKSGLAEIRFWYKDKLVGVQQVKNEDLNIPNFWLIYLVHFYFLNDKSNSRS